MAEPALLPAAQMERLAPVSLASPCPRIPRARIAGRPRRCAQRRTDLGYSSGPSSGPEPPQDPPRARPARGSPTWLSSEESLSMDGFWMEVERIQQRDEPREEDGVGEGRPLEEGETEAQWLRDTGLWELLGGRGAGSHPRGLLSTLTQTQAAAVRRRLYIYTRSARRRRKAPVRDVRDVRDVFGGLSAGEISPENGGSGLRWAQLGSRTPKPPPAAEPEGPQARAAMEEAFRTDSAYSEQAALLLQRGPQPAGGACAWSQGSLPTFRIPKGRLGLTRVGDLSSQDMNKIPALALIELTALCDVLGLDLKRSKAGKQKATETRLFGVPLEALLEADRRALPCTQVPLLLQALLSCLEKRGLDTEGILRVPGSQARVKGLEQKLERDFYTGLFSWDEVHHNDASDLLKRFIRELPAPLLTAEYLPAFAVVPNIPNLRQRLQALHLLILILPEPNRNALKALLEFLRKVVAREQSNKMTLWNVSTVMAPNLFLHRGQPPKLLKGREKQLAEGAAEVVQMMVHYQDLLWTVSSFLVAQLRKLNDSSGRRPQLCDGGLKTWLRRTHTDSDEAGDGPEAAPQVAKIQAAWPIKDTLEVPLTPSTKVAHVLRQFTGCLSPGLQSQEGNKDKDSLLPRSRLRKSADIVFYEVGGNISEHRLDPDAYLLDLYRANPCGEWVVKQSPA
ncbi:PREDICTED: rho GTPase-activating protein 40 [Miniopterus natalensis]|uniref:rho GTPase-activating protein 40 n=1 Tax=Miniopterus natalensis TaxID=291302 RepID=UPI0007A6ECE1|nr:PREDICTED: rho GTPase-activating protein 40 [Miniopterus natalensis]